MSERAAESGTHVSKHSERTLHDAAARQRISPTCRRRCSSRPAPGGQDDGLVGRVVARSFDEGCRSRIAAITFTEKAAAELRHRLRESERRAEASPTSDRGAVERPSTTSTRPRSARCTRSPRASSSRSRSRPGCRRRSTCSTRSARQSAFDERWEDMQRLLDDPSAVGRVCFARRSAARSSSTLRRVAQLFGNDWDLVDDRVAVGSRPPRPIAAVRIVGHARATSRRRRVPHRATSRRERPARVWSRSPTSSTRRRDGRRSLTPLGRSLAGRRCGKQGELGRATGRVPAGARPRRSSRPRADGEPSSTAHAAAAAPGRGASGTLALDAAGSAGATASSSSTTCWCSPATCCATTRRSGPRCTASYQRLLLDEFQDTDPIQLEIAVRHRRPTPRADGATGRTSCPARPAVHRRRSEAVDLPVPPGRHRAVPPGAPTRSAPTRQLERQLPLVGPCIEWVNHVFGELIQAEPDAQPAVPAARRRRPAPARPGSVTVLGADARTTTTPNAEDLREREAADVADAVATALARALARRRRRTTAARARLGDIAVLLPARTSLPHAGGGARRDADIPYRAENSSVVYPPPRSATSCCAARRDDPTDELALVAALRSRSVRLQRRRAVRRGSSRRSWSIWRQLGPDARSATRWPAAIAHVRSLAERLDVRVARRLIAALVDERRCSTTRARTGRPRRLAANPVRGRAGAGVERRRRPRPARATWLGRAPGVGEPRGRRHDPARARLRRGPDHDDPRRQRLEFPITVVTGLTTEPRDSLRSQRRVAPGHLDDRQQTLRDAIYDGLQTDRRADERRRAAAPALCRLHPCHLDHLIVSLSRKADSPDAGEHA